MLRANASRLFLLIAALSGFPRPSSGAASPLPLIPAPREVHLETGNIVLAQNGTRRYSIAVRGNFAAAALLPAELERRLARPALSAPDGPESPVHFLFALDPSLLPTDCAAIAATLKTLGPEGYVLETRTVGSSDFILIAGNSEMALWHGMATAGALPMRKGATVTFPRVHLVDYPQMTQRGLLVDLGGQGFMVGPSRWEFSQWKDFVDWMVDHKLNSLWLEFIGSGRLMGNLDLNAGQWCGYPLPLRSNPDLEEKDRPIRRWDPTTRTVVNDTYTAPNVRHEFVRDLIDYAQARGVNCILLIGYDYFAGMLPAMRGLPDGDPSNPAANRFYDAVLREIVGRYRDASGVFLHTVEGRSRPASMLPQVMRRTNEGYRIVKSINPAMQVGLIADYLSFRPLGELEQLKAGVPSDLALGWTPFDPVLQSGWKRVWGPDTWKYEYYSQYAWDHLERVFPEHVRDETLATAAAGFTRVVSQAWYFDLASINFLALAEYAWNPAAGPADGFWDRALDETFGPAARPAMRTALEDTSDATPADVVARMLLQDDIHRPYPFSDLASPRPVLLRLDDGMLARLETGARASLDAARSALPLSSASGRPLVAQAIISAERRLYLAGSARSFLRALALKAQGDFAVARREMAACLRLADQLEAAAAQEGIEYPMTMMDARVVAKFRAAAADLVPHPGSGVAE